MTDSKKLILSVDDDLDTLEIIRTKLEAHNFRVITAQDGQEALIKARAEKPDLIILDVMLPKASGFKVARILKFDEELGKIPIILLTARSQKADKDTGMQVGADDYIVKPFDPQMLLEKVVTKINEILK